MNEMLQITVYQKLHHLLLESPLQPPVPETFLTQLLRFEVFQVRLQKKSKATSTVSIIGKYIKARFSTA
jgi:hypothetical protein